MPPIRIGIVWPGTLEAVTYVSFYMSHTTPSPSALPLMASADVTWFGLPGLSRWP